MKGHLGPVKTVIVGVTVTGVTVSGEVCYIIHCKEDGDFPPPSFMRVILCAVGFPRSKDYGPARL